MTREDAGKYKAKHPAAAEADPAIAAALTEQQRAGRITCATAFQVAERLGVAPAVVGKTIDLLNYRILECQLGLFGYSPEKSIVRPLEQVPETLRDRLLGFAGAGISCASCWKLADALQTEKMTVAAACDTLGIKIEHCQLGAF